jgi:pimeloyl-ACP methyl ester carboxylesterase
MPQTLPFVLIPGLACSARLYTRQIPALWRLGPVMIANHTSADSMREIVRSILAHAPARFHLIALSMGGYLAFELMRQAPERVERLALLDTSARPDLPEQTERRLKIIGLAEQGQFMKMNDLLWPALVHESRQSDVALRATVDEMLVDTGPEALIRQQRALISRVDSRPTLQSIHARTLVVVGDADVITPLQFAQEIAGGIVSARLEVVPKCGHLSTLERPEPVTRLLTEWFTD